MITLRNYYFLKQITRISYTAGVAFLIVGLLLSLVSQPAYASQGNQTGASLVVESGCTGNCQQVTATVCNTGTVAMVAPVVWELHYSPNNANNRAYAGVSGQVGILEGKACQVISATPNMGSGNYWFKVYQPTGHPGIGFMFSDSCSINACAVPTQPTVQPTVQPTQEPTVEPTVDPTQDPTLEPTPEVTPEPTVQPTADATQDPTLEPTPEATPEPTQEPTAEPTQEPTSEPTESPLTMMPLEIDYACTGAGLEWSITNPNPYEVSLRWELLESDLDGDMSVGAEQSQSVIAGVGMSQWMLFTWTGPQSLWGYLTMTNGADTCVITDPTVTPDPTQEPDDGDPVGGDPDPLPSPTAVPTTSPSRAGDNPRGYFAVSLPPSSPLVPVTGQSESQLAPLDPPPAALASAAEVQALIPVTGADLTPPAASRPLHFLIYLGLVFIGVALMTQGVTRKVYPL